MRTIKIYIGLFIILLGAAGCEDTLDRDPQTNTALEYEEVFKDPHMAPGFLNHAYNYLPIGFSRMGDALFASASDEAKHSEGGSLIQLFNNDAISATANPDNVWYDMYYGIRICNIFLKEIDERNGLIARYNSIPNDQRSNFKAQAWFLRAFFHFELLKRYQNIFCVDKVLDPFNEGELFDVPQSNFHDAVRFIANDCDSAVLYLPDRHTDKTKDQYGRPTKAAPLALKSRLLLYAASPLNNPEQKKELWEKAEEVAKQLYDNASTYGITLLEKGNYAQVFTTPFNSEVIFAAKTENSNVLEQYNFPISYQGKGLTNPTQELVDCYVMHATSYENPMVDYSEEDPYALTGKRKREARFYATVLHNDASFKNAKVESFVGGKDGLYATSTATKTGYYLRKYLSSGIALEKNDKIYRSWILFRYAEIILNYAEARNEVLDSPADDKLLHDLLNLIRNRAELRPFTSKTSYIKDKAEMREYIKLERRKELAMEEHRFWDLRRWKEETTLKAPVHGMRIQRVEDGVDAENNPVYKFTYEKFKVEDRYFDTKFYWYPIPRAEILKYKSKGIEVKQNEGW